MCIYTLYIYTHHATRMYMSVYICTHYTHRAMYVHIYRQHMFADVYFLHRLRRLPGHEIPTQAMRPFESMLGPKQGLLRALQGKTVDARNPASRGISIYELY